MRTFAANCLSSAKNALTSCFKDPTPPPAPELRTMTEQELCQKVDEIRSTDADDSYYRANLAVDKFVTQEQLSRYNFESDRQSLLRGKLSSPQQHWLEESQKNSIIPMGATKFDWNMNRIPENQFFRLYIDRKRQDGGRLCFDDEEPGYAASMESAFKFLRTIIDQRLTPELYVKIHSAATKNVAVHPSSTNAYSRAIPQGIGEGNCGYRLNFARITPQAKQEWKSHKLLLTPNLYSRVTISDYTSLLREDGFVVPNVNAHCPNPKEVLERRLEKILTNHYNYIESATREIDKKRIIAGTCRSLEVAHFFNDGNQRTVVFLVLNKLLMDEGLLPSIPYQPVVFDGYLSIDELVEDIHEGQAFFQCLATSPKPTNE